MKSYKNAYLLNMEKMSIGLKLIGLYFVLSALFCIIYFISIIDPLLASKNILLISYSTIYITLSSVFSLITAVGIFKLKSWARRLAILLLIISIMHITISSIKNINIMIKNYVEMWILLCSAGISIAFVTIMFFLILYLTRDSIKEQFVSKAGRVSKAGLVTKA